MTRNPCCLFSCRGCLPMLVETIVYITTFFAAVLAVVYPLIGS